VLPNVLREDKGTPAPEEALQGDHFAGIDGCARSDALEGRPRQIIGPQQARAAPLVALRFHRGLKPILKEPLLLYMPGGMSPTSKGPA
jgi:hypothetical protein